MLHLYEILKMSVCAEEKWVDSDPAGMLTFFKNWTRLVVFFCVCLMYIQLRDFIRANTFSTQMQL